MSLMRFHFNGSSPSVGGTFCEDSLVVVFLSIGDTFGMVSLTIYSLLPIKHDASTLSWVYFVKNQLGKNSYRVTGRWSFQL